MANTIGRRFILGVRDESVVPGIRDEARELACPEPKFQADSFVTVTFRLNSAVCAAMGVDTVTPQVRRLTALSGEMARQQFQDKLDLRDGQHFRKAYLFPALQAHLIAMTIPEKALSNKQRYRLTATGRNYLNKTGETP